MLDMALDFYFPRLVHHSESTLTHHGHVAPDDWSGKTHKKVQLYRLDWKGFEVKKAEKFWDWASEYHSDKTVEYIPSLPEKYCSVIDDLVFHLDQKYLAEIHHCCQMAIMERCKRRPFDTMVRDFCLEPSTAYVYVAFRLICDCVFDEDKHYYRQHDWVRRIAHHAMLYKFWHHQTGRGLLWERAKMSELADVPSKSEVFLFYNDMKAHDKLVVDAETVLISDTLRRHSPEQLDDLVEKIRRS